MKIRGHNLKKSHRLRNTRHVGLGARLLPYILSVVLLFAATAISNGNFPLINSIAAPLLTTSMCNIKGNVSYNRGTKIFHVPGQENYSETVISSSRGERWFCSENEARAAGWRKARR